MGVAGISATTRNIALDRLWLPLIISVSCLLTGCGASTVTIGEDGIRVRLGEWVGRDSEGKYTIQLNVSYDDVGAKLSVTAYTYPCGEKYNSVFPSEPISIEVSDSAFETKVGQIILTGRFSDSTHVEGTWEVLPHQVPFLDTNCPPAEGTWTGSPK